LKCAENPDIIYVLSNTTEAGIAFDPNDDINASPPGSFPGKIAAYLYRRYEFFKSRGADLNSKGLIFMPCELNERNGDLLRSAVLKLAEHCGMNADFIEWVARSCAFLNTLVDRTVPGYPKDGNAAAALGEKLGYADGLLNICEIFHQWIIEDPLGLTEALPFEKAGLNVRRVSCVDQYRNQKVRILNGGHTSSVPAAFMYGIETVDEMMRHEITGKYVRKIIYEEIIPSLYLDGTPDELNDFADKVILRWENPLIKHYLSSILLNSVSKYAARVIDSIVLYCEKYKNPPELLSFSFAALIALYKYGKINGGEIILERGGTETIVRDDAKSLAFFAELWRDYSDKKTDIKALTDKILSEKILWGKDMTACCGLSEKVAEHLGDIINNGWTDTINKIIK
jgi:tagaturonate reductase